MPHLYFIHTTNIDEFVMCHKNKKTKKKKNNNNF